MQYRYLLLWWPKCPSFDDKMDCICNSCSEKQNFQEISQWAGRCRICPVTHTWKFWPLSTISVCISISSFESWYLLRAEESFSRQNPIFLCVVENLCTAKRRMISFWVCTETWWGTEQSSKRSARVTSGYPAGFKMGSNNTKDYRLCSRNVVLTMAICTWWYWNFLHLSGLWRMGFALLHLIWNCFWIILRVTLGMFA